MDRICSDTFTIVFQHLLYLRYTGIYYVLTYFYNILLDATANYVKSPPKDVKTNKNLQMRSKVQEPVQSLFRTEALSPTWTIGCKYIYTFCFLIKNLVSVRFHDFSLQMKMSIQIHPNQMRL